MSLLLSSKGQNKFENLILKIEGATVTDNKVSY